MQENAPGPSRGLLPLFYAVLPQSTVRREVSGTTIDLEYCKLYSWVAARGALVVSLGGVPAARTLRVPSAWEYFDAQHVLPVLSTSDTAFPAGFVCD